MRYFKMGGFQKGVRKNYQPKQCTINEALFDAPKIGYLMIPVLKASPAIKVDPFQPRFWGDKLTKFKQKHQQLQWFFLCVASVFFKSPHHIDPQIPSHGGGVTIYIYIHIYIYIYIYIHTYIYIYMGVSKNSGTPKSSILIGFSIINHPFWGTLFLETSISLVNWYFKPQFL